MILSKETEPETYIDFSDSAVYFHFEKGPGHNYGLVRLRIKENTWNITVKGTALTLGDPIGKLGGQFKTLANDDGTKAVFFDCEQCDESIDIDFDSKDRIKEIGYTVYD